MKQRPNSIASTRNKFSYGIRHLDTIILQHWKICITTLYNTICESSPHEKQRWSSFPYAKSNNSKDKLQLIQLDISEPTSDESQRGKRYFC